MKTKIKGWAVVGQWGITLVTTDILFRQEVFEKEQNRLKRLGFDSYVVPVEITLKKKQ